MFVYTYNYTDLHSLLHDFAQKTNSRVQGTTLNYNEKFADGYSRLINVADGIQAWLSDYRLNEDICVIRQGSATSSFILRVFETVVKEKKVTMGGSGEMIEKHDQKNYAVLYNDNSEVSVILQKGTNVRGVEIVFTPKWLMEYLHIDNEHFLLQKFLSVQDQQLHHVPLNYEYITLLNELFAPSNKMLEQTIMSNRIMILVEKFFVQMANIFSNHKEKIRISHAELDKLNEVKSILTDDSLQSPPTIPELSRMIGMSASSLKNKFKKLFQSGIYQYYQKHRLHKAMDMLASGKYSVKEVGMELGFINLSNFSIAFKKEFGILPSEVTRRKGSRSENNHQ